MGELEEVAEAAAVSVLDKSRIMFGFRQKAGHSRGVQVEHLRAREFSITNAIKAEHFSLKSFA